MAVGPIAASNPEGGKSYVWHTEDHRLRPWMHRVNKKLFMLSEVLRNCKTLKELSLEASSEYDPALGPRWDYLCGSTVTSIMRALPIGLKNLTLDTCGSKLTTSSHNGRPAHLCSYIALRLQDFEHVRIRMRHICPQILDTSTNLSDTRSRLKTLIIRLSLPMFPEASYEMHRGHTEFDAQACPGYQSNKAKEPLYRAMINAGLRFASEMKLDMMRITYRATEGSGIDLCVADCVREKRLWEPSEIFSYDDDGRAWDGWEDDDESLREGTPFEELW